MVDCFCGRSRTHSFNRESKKMKDDQNDSGVLSTYSAYKIIIPYFVGNYYIATHQRSEILMSDTVSIHNIILRYHT